MSGADRVIGSDERIDWIFKALNLQAGELSESEAEWIIRFEEQWKARRRLSPRQIEILESIYEKHA